MSLIACSHCHLEFDESLMINEPENKNLHFCCNGCQGVYHLLKDDGLDSFYEKVGKNKLAKPLAVGSDSSNFDMESFTTRYIKKTDEGFSRVDLIIEGIHCAACIWLNEKVLDQTAGIVEVNINFTNNKAKIIWDEDVIKLSQIIDKIRSIGYNAYPYDRTESEKKATKNKKDFFLRMSIAIFASMNIMMIDVAKYTGYFTGIDDEMLRIIHMAEFIFATPVLFYSGWIFFRGAYYGLKNKIINMDFLVSFGATLSYIYSLYVLFGGAGDSYFDSVAMIITFVLVGKYLEVLGKKSAVDTMDKIKSQIPLEATIIKNGGKKVVSLDEIKVDDIIEVKTGEKASVDGEVVSGFSSFDESSISGESLPVSKTTGDKIYSGTINTQAVIRYKAVKNYANSTLNNIVELLEDSLNSKPKIEDTTNEISKYFSIIILTLSLATFIAWYLYVGGFENSLIVAISVIIIACPCALALATPIASLIGISWLSQEGLLFKEAKFLETFAKIDAIVFDKTGTLTTGKLTVKKVPLSLTKKELNILYSLADSSTHPVSVAIKNYLEECFENLDIITLEEIEQLPSMGLQARYNNNIIFGGRLENNVEYQTTIYHFTINDKLLATFELEDKLREDAKSTVEYFKKQNIKTILCSGDNEQAVSSVAKEVGVDHYNAKMSPIAKADYIQSLKDSKKSVVMVGDGINDSLALSRANISIAMGNGADISIAISDIVILNDKLEGIKKSHYISQRTFKFIKQNLMISTVYNILTIPIAMAGYIIPLVAALSMSLSSLLVVGNSLRIKNRKIDE
ncbi:heavy metal translocating P-type ATPase [Arcobacter sp. 15-2]|uniref:heavy metal translocating P-type ATPase n=1 Tax=Arcobacter sp. 15-2 TaxID=3374109 RepID=UPI00399D2738